MDFSPNEQQALLKQLTERFVTDLCAQEDRAAHPVPDSGRNAERWTGLAELGLLSLPVPEDMGGLGGGRVETMVFMEALGRGLVAEPVLHELYMGAIPLALFSDAPELLAEVMAGTGHYALAFAEPDQRYRLDYPRTIAREANGEFLIEGAKTFVLAGDDVDGFIVSARGASAETGLFLVDSRARGVSRRAYRLIDGAAAQELAFDSVCARPLKGGAGALEGVADEVRFAAASEMLGIMEILFSTTLEYLRTRKQFGVAIGSFQALQHRMADLYADLECARSLLYRAALVPETGRPAATAAAKSFIGKKGVRLAEECVQLHGGMGVSDELTVGHGLKRILVLASLFGDPEAELTRYTRLAREGEGRSLRQADAQPSGLEKVPESFLEDDVTPAFPPAATRDRPVSSRSSVGEERVG